MFKRLDQLLNESLQLEIDEKSRIVIFSDCHRGDNSLADDFANNEPIYLYALENYFNDGFTYIELGDGDDLWKFDFASILQAHSNIFRLIRKFHEKNRFQMIFGNHDIERKYASVQKKHSRSIYFDEELQTEQTMFPSLNIQESLVLNYKSLGKLFLVHGHQGQLLNEKLWWVNKLLVKFLWRSLQNIGIRDPNSPAKNHRLLKKVEERITDWIKSRKQVTITGHTHRPRFPEIGETPYFNTGSCVHPRSITGIEIISGEISLIKWHIKPNVDGLMKISKELMAGPVSIPKYLNSMKF